MYVYGVCGYCCQHPHQSSQPPYIVYQVEVPRLCYGSNKILQQAFDLPGQTLATPTVRNRETHADGPVAGTVRASLFFLTIWVHY